MSNKDYANFISTCASIPQLFEALCHKNPNQIVIKYPIYNQDILSDWASITREQILTQVKSLANYLSSLGVSKNSKVTIISGTRPEWLVCDLAILYCQAVTVSVYPSLPPAEVGFILADSESTVVICENQEQLDKIKFLQTNEILLPARDNISASNEKIKINHIICIEEVVDKNIPQLDDIIRDKKDFYFQPDITKNDLASLVYTSGTTGPAKGVMQTHGNHLANIRQATLSGVFGLSSSMFLFLPLAHSFARLIAYLGLLTPATLIFCSVANKKKSTVDLIKVAQEMSKANAQIIPSVPRLFEKIKSSLEIKKPGLLNTLLWLTIFFIKKDFKLGRVLTSFIIKKIKPKVFGQNFQHAISGGAKLPVDVAKFFKELDIKILEGYGLTETCVATNVNLPHKWKIGSVGPVFQEIEIKIAPDGEILFKGPNITQGYWNRPIATKESWDQDGWFHTGDIGFLDEEGFLYITDRKKDIVVTAGGKKIPPLKVENLLMTNSLISHAIYYGDGKPYCVALVTLNPNSLTPEQITSNLNNLKHQVNKQLASYEKIKKIIQLPEELTIDNGLLTPTLKVKRKEVFKKYKELIDSLYDNND